MRKPSSESSQQSFSGLQSPRWSFSIKVFKFGIKHGESNLHREEKLKAWAMALCWSVGPDVSSDEVLKLVIRYSKLSCVGVGVSWQELHELRTLYSFWKYAGNNIRCQGTLYTSCQVKQPQSLCKWHRLGAPLILPHLYFRWALFNSFL